MRLVNSYLSRVELTENDIFRVTSELIDSYSRNIEVNKFKYPNRIYYEVDFDILEIDFTKESIIDDIKKLVLTHEKILHFLKKDVDIIVANDDTETEILRYEIDNNDIADCGLFITKRQILNLEPFYSSKYCNAYLNFEYVSFGVMY